MVATPSNDGRKDLEAAISSLADHLPEPLAPLAGLAFNYRWSWMPDGEQVFEKLNPELWRLCKSNPRDMLQAIPQQRLRELAKNADYVQQVQSLARACVEDLQGPPLNGLPADHPIAYFCAEFGFHCSMPIYSGGLGILAGDILKTASDLAVPMLGIGLFYRQGYFHQRLDTSGWQHEYWVDTAFSRLPAVRVTGDDGAPLGIELGLRGRRVVAHIWRIEVGRTTLYLLDVDHEANDALDRWITARLYVGDRFIRLAQYAVLGIGGVRALAAMGIQPSLVHLNEGHAALGSFERLRRRIADGKSFDAALEEVSRSTVFTTHTPVAAGNEGYHENEIETVLSQFLNSLGMPRQTFYDLGRLTPGKPEEAINITPLALRTSRASIGVSQKHGEVARGMWQPLWPDRAAQDVPIGHVTNGVHLPTWMAPHMQSLLRKHLGTDWQRHVLEPGFMDRIDQIPDEDLWAVRCTQRAILVELARRKSIRDRLGRGEDSEYVQAASQAFRPETITVGFARRVANYKRLYLLSRLPEGGSVRLLGDSPTPMQLILAGKAHPADQEAKEELRNRFQLKQAHEVGRRVVFLEDYDLHTAPAIVAGVDVWLNLPRPPLEASGTSGMKVMLNGGLNLSVMDGWWMEAFDGENGWAIHSPEADADTQDEHDARVLFETLEQQVIPLFYERDESGIPRAWINRVKRSMRTLIPRFTAERMVREYVDKLYRQPA